MKSAASACLLAMGHEWQPRDKWTRSMTLLKEEVLPKLADLGLANRLDRGGWKGSMKPGELVAARMSGGITIVRVVGVDAARVRVALRRKKEARLPADRVVLSTQVFAEGDEQVADFRRQSENIASEVDIAELWEVVSDEQVAYSFDDLAELYWGADASPAQQVALLLCLDRDSLYFEDGKAGYTPRSPSAVEETLARRKRQAQQAAEADDLVAWLKKGGVAALAVTAPADAHRQHARLRRVR